MSALSRTPLAERVLVLRTRGRRRGPITRLVSPSAIGKLIKPFVFLDRFDVPATGAPNFGWHPHSGIATLIVLHKGAIDAPSRFVLGSAAKHRHDLVLGRYSVHTTPAALVAGESEIRRTGDEFVSAGPLRWP